jgi:hypothetical protein
MAFNSAGCGPFRGVVDFQEQTRTSFRRMLLKHIILKVIIGVKYQ